MNSFTQITTSTLQIFLFLMPGIIFTRFYYNNEFSREFFKRSFFELVLITFFPAFIIFGITYWVLETPYFGLEGTKLFYDEIELSNQNFFAAHLIIWTTSGLLGSFFKLLVRYLKLDIKFKLLRFNNKWHYIYSGEFFMFPTNNFFIRSTSIQKIEVRVIESVVIENNKKILFRGIWETYGVDNNGDLDYIIISEVKKNSAKYLNQVLLTPNPKRSLTIIDAKKIINSSITYYKFTGEKDDPKLETVSVIHNIK